MRLSLILAALALFAFALLPGAGSASNTPFDVNSTEDVVDANPGDVLCATGGGVCTLRAAVQEANETPGRDTITIPAGTYTLTIPGDHEEAAAEDDLDVLEDLTINGAGQSTTIVDGGGFTRVFDIIPTDVDVDISGLTLRNGMAPTVGGAIDNHANLTLADVTVTGNTGPQGGGISNRGDLTLMRVSLNGNTAPSGGGGLWIEPEGSATIHDSSVANNSSGAFTDGSAILIEGSLTIEGSTVNNNSSGRAALNIEGDGSAAITNTAIQDNVGGGIEISTSGATTIAGSTIAGNSNTNGGGIAVDQDGPVTITDTSFIGNTASNLGAAIFQDSSAVMMIERVTLAGNSAGRGGGISILDDGPTTLKNVTMSGNSATQQGGAIWRGWAAPFTVINSTIVSNDSPVGGGIYAEEPDPFTLKNTILANNTDDNCAFAQGGKTTSQGHNLSSDNSCKLNAASDLKNTDPKLGPLADNGAPTQTHALLPDSPAIDAGDANGCPDEDQRGVARPIDGPDDDTDAECDIGAFEFGIVATPTPSPTPALELTQGDVDCNGIANSVDSLKILRYVAQLPVSQPPDCPLIGSVVASFFGDVDCGGGVNSVDALKILRFVAQLSVAQTEPCPNIGDPL